MCGYDPFYWYDWMLDREAEMNDLGFDNYDDYIAYLDDLKHDTQIQDYESKMGY